MRRTFILFLMMIFILALSACGGDKTDNASDTADSTPAASDSAGTDSQDADTQDAAQESDSAQGQKDEETADSGDKGDSAAEAETDKDAGTQSGSDSAPTQADSGKADAPSAGEPAESAPEAGAKISLSAQQQYEANIFLSNFSEQGFCGGDYSSFDAASATDVQIFSFAHLWAKINSQSAIEYKDGFEVMSLETVRDIANRYMRLDRQINPAEGTDYSKEMGMGNYDWDRCWFEEGLFYYPAADGEVHTGFTVVDSAESRPDGLVAFEFTTYDMDLDSYFDFNGIPNDYYRMTSDDAERLAATGEISPNGTGRALCEPKTLKDSGRQTYALVSYEMDPA